MSTLYGNSSGTNPLSGFADELPQEDEVDPWGPPPSSTNNNSSTTSTSTSIPTGNLYSSTSSPPQSKFNQNAYQESSPSSRFNDSYISNPSYNSQPQPDNYNQPQSNYYSNQQSTSSQSPYNSGAVGVGGGGGGYDDAAPTTSPYYQSQPPQPQQQPPPQQQAYQPYSHQGQPNRPSPFASASSPSIRPPGPPQGSSFRKGPSAPAPVYSPFARVESLNNHRDNNTEDMYGVPENFLEVEVRNPTTHG